MMQRSRLVSISICLVALGAAHPAGAQEMDAARAFVQVANGYRLIPNITYLRASGQNLRLDVYQPRGTGEATPTLLYFHGGGWTNGSKESSALTFLPYLEMGWTVVNVQYRLADVAHAPAAVEDCRCALRWVYRNAEQYGFDLDRIVVTGNSAGGHLALTTGMLPESAGLDRQCPGDRNRSWDTGARSTEPLAVAAIVNWYGITDVVDLIDRTPGPSGNYTVAWLGSAPDREETARRVSPLTYVRPDLPPVLTIHGDADPIVPYEHGVRLHEALDAAGVSNRLVTVPGGGHGGFSDAENVEVYTAIRAFLVEHGVERATPGQSVRSDGTEASETIARTAWGAPDLQGVWSTATVTPLERPEGVAEFLTDEEVAEIEHQAVIAATDEARGRDAQSDVRGAYNDFWWDRGTRVAGTRRTSLIFDPANGRLPALTPAAGRYAHSEDSRMVLETRRGMHPAASYTDTDLWDRCLTRGLPMRPGPYNNNFQIFQTRDHLVVLHEMIHDARVIPIHDRPGVPSPAIPQWFGTSSAHWEDETLVVVTKHFAGKQELPFEPQMTAQGMTLTERFTPRDDGTLDYTFTVAHPEVYSQTWSAQLPLRPVAGQMYEYACHEGNYGIVGILQGSRNLERRR